MNRSLPRWLVLIPVLLFAGAEARAELRSLEILSREPRSEERFSRNAETDL